MISRATDVCARVSLFLRKLHLAELICLTIRHFIWITQLDYVLRLCFRVKMNSQVHVSNVYY